MTVLHGQLGRISRVGVEVSQIALGQGVAVVGGIVGVRFLTSLLTPVQYGELALAITVGNFVIQGSLGPLQQGALRFFGPAREVRELGACLSATWRLVWRTGRIVAACAAVLTLAMLIQGGSVWLSLGLGSLLLALVSGCERVLDALQIAGRQRAVTAWHQGLAQWLRFAVAVVFIHWFGSRSSTALAGYVTATIIVLASQGFFFWFRWRAAIAAEVPRSGAEEKWRRRIWEYARPFMAWGAFSWLQQSSDRWALQTFSAASDVGYYSVLFQLGYVPVILVTGVVVQMVQPIVFSRSGDGTNQDRVAHARRVNHMLVGAFLGVALLGAIAAQLLHTLVFRFFVDPQYHSASWLMPWMVLAAGLFACGELAALVLMSGLQTHRLRVIKISTALIGIGLNIAGAAWRGLPGVVFGTLAFSLVSLVWTAWASTLSAPMVAIDEPLDAVELATLSGPEPGR